MSFPKILAITTVILFSMIGLLAFFKGERKNTASTVIPSPLATPIEIKIKPEKPVQIKAAQAPVKLASKPLTPVVQIASAPVAMPPVVKEAALKEDVPVIDRTAELFNKGDPKFPFVETITYKSRVSWQKGRPAWLSDYANYYNTSRHFIARSLNGRPEYFKQDITEGERFNVLRKDLNLQFHLLVDTSRCKLLMYCLDTDNHQHWLIKTYDVGLGRPDTSRASGMLTPYGKYTLGSKIAIYKPKMLGVHNGQKIEMVRVFGTRWIPFDKELVGCTAPAKGFGIHGVPWVQNTKGELIQDKNSLGKYESDGCIRLATEDIEEIFAIIITKPTTIELVKDYHDAVIPGVEKI
jgi:hypothetical protein